MTGRAVVVACGAVWLACSPPAFAQPVPAPRLAAAQAAALPAALRQLPASFSGVLPCADCEGIRYRLNLFPDGAFHLLTTYLGRAGAAPRADLGTWLVSSNQRVLVLKGGGEAPVFFRLVDGTTLRKLDLEGRDITSSLNYALVRAAAFEPVDARLTVRGVFSYMADAGLFTECLTGQRWPVAHEGDNAALEREYAKVRAAPGDPVLVSLEARLATRPAMEGAGRQPTLVPERVIGAFAGGRCDSRPVTAPLASTRWALTRLGAEPVTPRDPARAPALVFDDASGRVAGSGGCNRITGKYARAGIDGLSLGPMAGTMMACPDGMDTERAFLTALNRVTSFNILASILELYDDAGSLVARFEARPAEPAK